MFLLWCLLNPPAAWLSTHHITWTQTAKFIFLSYMSGLMYVNCARFPLCLYMTKLKHETLLAFLYIYEVLCAHVDRLGTDKNREEK